MSKTTFITPALLRLVLKGQTKAIKVGDKITVSAKAIELNNTDLPPDTPLEGVVTALSDLAVRIETISADGEISLYELRLLAQGSIELVQKSRTALEYIKEKLGKAFRSISSGISRVFRKS